jgi:hypothetical protein
MTSTRLLPHHPAAIAADLAGTTPCIVSSLQSPDMSEKSSAVEEICIFAICRMLVKTYLQIRPKILWLGRMAR